MIIGLLYYDPPPSHSWQIATLVASVVLVTFLCIVHIHTYTCTLAHALKWCVLIDKGKVEVFKKTGSEIGKAAATKSGGLFSADDWQCSM